MASLTLVLAACGSSSSSSSSSASPASASSSSSSASTSTAAASGLIVSTAKANGTAYLVGPSGRALYLWMADTNGKSACSGACAAAWPPLTTTGTPSASGGAMSADLGTTTRADGSKQVTYKGHPLYYFTGDPKAGTTNGQGSDGFGAKWWLVSPAGSAITASGSSSSSSSAGAYG